MEWIVAGDNLRELHSVDGVGSEHIRSLSWQGDRHGRFRRCDIERRDIHDWTSGSHHYLDHPSFCYRGRCGFTLTINGTGYVPQSTVTFNCNDAPTYLTSTFVSATQLTAFVPASLIASPENCYSRRL